MLLFPKKKNHVDAKDDYIFDYSNRCFKIFFYLTEVPLQWNVGNGNITAKLNKNRINSL